MTKMLNFLLLGDTMTYSGLYVGTSPKSLVIGQIGPKTMGFQSIVIILMIYLLGLKSPSSPKCIYDKNVKLSPIRGHNELFHYVCGLVPEEFGHR